MVKTTPFTFFWRGKPKEFFRVKSNFTQNANSYLAKFLQKIFSIQYYIGLAL